MLVHERPVQACTGCSVAWLPAGDAPAAGTETAAPVPGLPCPQCGEAGLTELGTGGTVQAWRCITCGGHLVKLTGHAFAAAGGAVTGEPSPSEAAYWGLEAVMQLLADR